MFPERCYTNRQSSKGMHRHRVRNQGIGRLWEGCANPELDAYRSWRPACDSWGVAFRFYITLGVRKGYSPNHAGPRKVMPRARPLCRGILCRRRVPSTIVPRGRMPRDKHAPSPKIEARSHRVHFFAGRDLSAEQSSARISVITRDHPQETDTHILH